MYVRFVKANHVINVNDMRLVIKSNLEDKGASIQGKINHIYDCKIEEFLKSKHFTLESLEDYKYKIMQELYQEFDVHDIGILYFNGGIKVEFKTVEEAKHVYEEICTAIARGDIHICNIDTK